MSSRPSFLARWWPSLLMAALAAAWGVDGSISWWRNRERRVLREEVLEPLHSPHHNDEGFWVGDVAENFRLGKISRRLAEADAAPLNPLVPKPIPIHGYYVRVMNSAPARFDNQPGISLKGIKRCKDAYAILVYPAEPGPEKWTFIFSDLGPLFRHDAWTPTFDFPTDDEVKCCWGKE